MVLFEVNFLPVVVAAVIHYLFGWFWYSPKVFGNAWLEGMGYRKGDCTCTWQQLVGAFVVSFVTTWVFAVLLDYFTVRDVASGVWLGFYIWLGFVVTKLFSDFLWTKQTFTVFLINAGHAIIGLIFIGAFLTWWHDRVQL